MTINEDSISPQSPSLSSSCYNDQVQSIATKLKAVIDDYNINYLANAEELILKLAILLDESNKVNKEVKSAEKSRKC
jgi:hypothetical protein